MQPPALSIDTLLAHRGWVRALALALVRDEHRADDLVQQTWLRALEHPPTRTETVRGWLGTVVRNLARDGWKTDARRDLRERSTARAEGVPSTVVLVARAEAHRRLIRHVTRLREPWRTVLLLRYFEDLPPREIARRLGLPATTVRTRLHRALRELRTTLGDESDGGAWLAALVPLPGAAVTGALLGKGGSSLGTLLGGLVMTTQQKVLVAGALLLLLCGGGTWLALRPADDAPDETETATAPDKPAPQQPSETEPERRHVTPPLDPAPEEAPAAEPVAADEEPVAAPPVAPSQPERESLSFTICRHVTPREVPEGFTELLPGEEPVIDDPGTAMGGGSGPRMLPYWSRWAPVPEKGTVTIRGRITDASGRGVPGAEVYRVKLDEHGKRASPASFQWVKTMTTTADDGTYEATAQPSGSYLVAADWNGALRRSRGLDIATAVAATAGDGDTLDGIALQLPIETARLASVSGVVLDESGRPKQNVEIDGPYQRIYTDAEGHFVMSALQPGTVTISTRSVGYAAQRLPLDLAPGAKESVEIRLELAEKGDLVLEGRVLDEEDLPVAHVPIFMAASRYGSRWASTDDQGVFRFENVDGKYAKTHVKVMVSPYPERDRVLAVGAPADVTVPAPGLTLRVRRTTPLHVLLRDKESGEALPLYAMTARVEEIADGEAQWRQFTSMSVYDEDGEADLFVPRGRFRLEIRAKDHRGVEVEVEVLDTNGEKEVRVDMEREEASPPR